MQVFDIINEIILSVSTAKSPTRVVAHTVSLHRHLTAVMTVSRSPSPERDLFGLTTELVPERENKRPATSPLDFDGLLSSPLLLHEDLQDGCGGQLWPAGMLLSKYMLTHHKDLHNERIVEIGAGGGLVGLAVAMGCNMIDNDGSKLIISDQIPMFSLMQKNIALNKLEDKVEAVIYDWGTPAPTSVLQPAPDRSSGYVYPTIILAADCVYFEPAFPLLLQTLIDIIGPNTICYFCFKKRRKADMRFIKDMTKQFDVAIPEYDGKMDDQKKNIFLYQLTKKHVS